MGNQISQNVEACGMSHLPQDIQDSLAELPGDSWTYREDHDAVVREAEKLVARGFSPSEAFEVIRAVFDAAASEFGESTSIYGDEGG